MLRRVGWTVVAAALLASGLSACAASQIGAGTGLSLAALVAGLLLFGGTQTGCTLRPCLSIEPIRDPPGPDAGPAPERLDVCLSIAPPKEKPEAPPPPVGPCLSMPAPGPVKPAPAPPKDKGSSLDRGDRREVLASLQDRLPEDVQARLGLTADEPRKG